MSGTGEKIPTRDEALALVEEWTESASLRRHALAVEAAMRAMARRAGADEELWGVVGLVHDFDYERHPEPPDHTRRGAEHLRELGWSEEIVGAMLSHAHWNQDEYPLDTQLRRALFAVDELTGFTMACALVRPTRLEGMKAKSVRKKLKQPSFAAQVSRDDIERGVELLEIDINELIEQIVAALEPVADRIGLGSG